MCQVCANCGGSLDKEDRFCGDCGIEIIPAAISANVYVENGEVISEQDGVLSNMADHISKLMNKSTPFDKIIIEFAEIGDFLQYFFTEEIMQLDFPITTPRQKELSAKAFTFLSELDYLPFMAETTDNQKLMLCDLKGSPQDMAELSTKLAIELFGIDPSNPIKFILMGPENQDQQPPD